MFQRRSHALAASICLLINLLTVVISSSAQDVRPIFTEGTCPIELVGNGEIVCGTLTVPEDRQGSASDTIALAVVIYKATGAAPQDTPIVFLQGGPGGRSISSVAALYSTQFAPLNEAYDIIVMDQRGTGFSQPALTCPQIIEASLATLTEILSMEDVSQRIETALAGCRADLEAKGINTAAYTTTENAGDFADLLQALDIPQANFYGSSYGTRLGQTILRDTPALVRSMVFDGVIPIEVNQVGEQGRKTQFALDALFTACSADAACQSAYPDLAQDFDTALKRLRTAPTILTVPNPLTGENMDVALTDSTFISAVFLAQQQASTIPLVPQAIHQAAAGVYDNLSIFLVLPLLYLDAIDTGMFYSVICSEEVLNTSPENLNNQLAAYADLGDYVYSITMGDPENLFTSCRNWGAKAAPARESEPLQSDLPSLIISGQFDPATPPYLGQQLADQLSNSSHVIVPGAGHVPGLSSDCTRQIILAYFADPTAEPQTRCLNDLPPVQFAGADYGTSETSEIELVPYRSESEGITGLSPKGWSEVQPGVLVRGASFTDVTLALVGKSSSPAADFWEAVGSSFGVTEAPAPVETLEANGYSFTLYTTPGSLSGSDVMLDVALADLPDNQSLRFILITVPDERDALYESLFISMLNALRVE